MTDKNDAIEQMPETNDIAAQDDKQEVCFDYQEVDQLMTTIEEKNRLLQEQNERYQRLQADFDNFRRRTRQEKEELSLLVCQNIIHELLPVLDNFERALSSDANQDAVGLRAGVEMIYRQFSTVLEKNGLEAIQAVGLQFDPQLHEAIMRVDDASQPDGTIIEELQKGYSVRGKVIRPSMVKVTGN